MSVVKPHDASTTATLWPHPLVNRGGGVSRVVDPDDMVSSNGGQELSIWTPTHGKQLQT